MDNAAASITAAFPGLRFKPPQYETLARLWSGEDLRAWQVDWRIVAALQAKGAVVCLATTNRLLLLTAEAIVSRLAQLDHRIAALDDEADFVDQALTATDRSLRHILATIRAQSAAVLTHQPAAASGGKAARALAQARFALAMAQETHRDLMATVSRQHRRRDEIAADLFQLRRERIALDRAAARRGITS